jgi:hypothetical protein
MDKINGLGDVVKSVTNFFGIIPCDACEERRVLLNKLFPFIKDAAEITQDEINFLKRIVSSNVIGAEDGNQVFAIYNRVYNENLTPCNCGSIILELREKLWNTYIANQSKNIDEI